MAKPSVYADGQSGMATSEDSSKTGRDYISKAVAMIAGKLDMSLNEEVESNER